jgi:DNA uptake protein ComE-like DNA-binding protein
MMEWLRGYLVFSKKERTGVFALLMLIFSVWLLPGFFGRPARLSEAMLLKADSAHELLSKAGSSGDVVVKTFRLFPFDPNLVTDADWETLGVRSKTIMTIRKYLNSGGRFRRPEDLMRIYGLRKDEAERLIPFVRIQQEADPEGKPTAFARYPSRASSRSEPRPYKPFATQSYRSYYSTGASRSGSNRGGQVRAAVKIVDINEADSSIFESLPGIGPRLASRIIRFRNACGGFYSVDQVSEIYGISDTLFLTLKPLLALHQQQVKKIFINDWDADSLAMHPYIQRHEAKAIVNFRKQHGRFERVEDLAKVSILTNEWLGKLSYYLSFE